MNTHTKKSHHRSTVFEFDNGIFSLKKSCLHSTHNTHAEIKQVSSIFRLSLPIEYAQSHLVVWSLSLEKRSCYIGIFLFLTLLYRRFSFSRGRLNVKETLSDSILALVTSTPTDTMLLEKRWLSLASPHVMGKFKQ